MSLAHNIFNTSLGRKYLMALTGAGLFGFVVMHMLGNLTIFAGQAAINEYAAKLHSLGPLWGANWAAGDGCNSLGRRQIVFENKKARQVRYVARWNRLMYRKNQIVSRYALAR